MVMYCYRYQLIVYAVTRNVIDAYLFFSVGLFVLLAALDKNCHIALLVQCHKIRNSRQ